MKLRVYGLVLCAVFSLAGCDDSASTVFGVDDEASTETATETETETEVEVVDTLAISNFSSRMPIAASLELVLLKTLADGTTETPATTDATWQTSDAAVATVDAGVVIGLTQGTATITASVDGLIVSSELEIYPVLLSALAFSPDPLEINECAAAEVVVTGTFADGTQFRLLPPLDATPPAGVLVTDTEAGVEVAAADSGSYAVPFTRSSISDSLQVVASDALASITLSETSVALASGASIALTATGAFNDGSTETITDRGSWSVLASTAADTVTLSTGAVGTITAGSTGSATVRFECGGLQSDVDILVNGADILEFIVIDDGATEVDLAAGEQQSLVLTAHYADGSEVDVTEDAEWQITLGDAVNIDVGNVIPDKGVVTVDPGVVAETSAVVEASFGGSATLVQVFAERP